MPRLEEVRMEEAQEMESGEPYERGRVCYAGPGPGMCKR
jgi:hypothetical protein